MLSEHKEISIPPTKFRLLARRKVYRRVNEVQRSLTLSIRLRQQLTVNRLGFSFAAEVRARQSVPIVQMQRGEVDIYTEPCVDAKKQGQSTQYPAAEFFVDANRISDT
ncbi:hypothetical protein D9M69_685350 [compost metagenome]